MINLKKLRNNIDIWFVLSTILSIIILLPNLNILLNLFQKATDNWEHIKEYLLKSYFINTSIIIICTGLFSGIIGLISAWLVTAYKFPLRKFFSWGLMLPLAIPAYIGAFTYDGLLNYTGVIQTFLRNNLNIGINNNLFHIRNIWGAIFIFTIFLYPYVFIISKSYLSKFSNSIVENAKLLGKNNLEIFLQIIVPMSRVSLVAGISLVVMEVLNDYGVVKYFGISTFSTAIFKTWFGMGDTISAIRLSAILMALVFGILFLEKILRGNKKYSSTSTTVKSIKRQNIEGKYKYLTTGFLMTIFSLGFIVPTLQLIHWGFLTYEKILDKDFFEMAISSISVGVIASILVVIIALIIGNFTRLSHLKIKKVYSRITTLGYSIPGAVIAIGVITLFIKFDRFLKPFYKKIPYISGNLLFSTSIIMLIFAYIIRFLAIGYNSIESSFEKVGNKFTNASRLLGHSTIYTFIKIDIPMIRQGILSGLLLVFIEVIKELPLSLILRPFNFNTLATKAYEYANDEMIHEASIASLFIIAISVISLITIQSLFKRRKT